VSAGREKATGRVVYIETAARDGTFHRRHLEGAHVSVDRVREMRESLLDKRGRRLLVLDEDAGATIEGP
jgi:hypothetical protein